MRTTIVKQKTVRIALGAAIGLGAAVGGQAAADAAPGRVNTAGASLTVRSGPGAGYAAVGTLRKDASFMGEEHNHVRPDTYSYRRATRGEGRRQFSEFIRFTR